MFSIIPKNATVKIYVENVLLEINAKSDLSSSLKWCIIIL
jgi:hypothetical protein